MDNEVRLLDATENHGLEQEMIEGYIATREDCRELNRDWQTVDGESWPVWDDE